MDLPYAELMGIALDAEPMARMYSSQNGRSGSHRVRFSPPDKEMTAGLTSREVAACNNTLNRDSLSAVACLAARVASAVAAPGEHSQQFEFCIPTTQ